MEQTKAAATKESLDFDERLLQITLDQLRTLVAVASTRSPRRAAQQLKRDQSSIEKQLRTLNTHFREMADEELLVRPPQRGGEVELTHAGQAVAEMARAALASLDEAVVRLRDMQQDRPLRLALTTFLLPLLLEIQDDISLEFTRYGLHFSKELIHVRSSEVQRVLLPEFRDKRIDFALGGFTTRASDDSDVSEQLEFLEWRRDRIVLLMNYPPPVSRVHVDDVRRDRWPLILPRGGVVSSFVDQVWGSSDGLHVLEWCGEVHFALELISLGVHEAAMLSTGSIAQYALSTSKIPLHIVELDGCDVHLRVGLFRRRTDALTYLPRHPRCIFWTTCKAIVGKPGSMAEEGSQRALAVRRNNKTRKSGE